MLIRYKSIKFIPLRTLSLCLDLWVLCQCILVYCILCFNNSENISLITYVMGLWSGVSIDMIFEPWPETNPNDGIWARMLEMAMVVAHHLTVLVAVNIAQGCHTHFERCELKSGDSRLSHENACFKLTFDLFFSLFFVFKISMAMSAYGKLTVLWYPGLLTLTIMKTKFLRSAVIENRFKSGNFQYPPVYMGDRQMVQIQGL